MANFGDARTVQWAPELPRELKPEVQTVQSGKMPQASTGACDACRARKVRCLANESSMSSKCQRCARAGRECVYTVHSKTRRRKRTDTRVKELEEKVKNLSMLLEQGKGETGQPIRRESGQGHESEDAGMGEEDEDWSDVEGEPELQDSVSSGSRNFDGFTAFREADLPGTAPRPQAPSQAPKDAKSTPIGSVSPDVIEQGIITVEKAQELFYRYINVLAPDFPGVYFPPDTSAVLMRKERPILFLAMLAAGAGNQDPALNLALNQQILQVFATNVAIRGLKSLELVISILISTLWYFPPDRFEELKFHQYIHMAATMAQDIGLGKKPRVSRASEPSMHSTIIPGYPEQDVITQNIPKSFYPDATSMEARRTILACYLSCSTVSMGLRLPNMLRFTSWMNECLHELETSPEAAPTDKRFAAWIRIQRVVEECAVSFSLDDPGSTASLSDERIQQMLRGYEGRLQDLMKSMKATPGVLNGFLEINYHINNIYIHEIALHPEHDAEDFKPPFFVTTRSNKVLVPLAPAYVSAITECMTSAQAVIKTFLGMPVERLRSLPALLYMRICYSCIILIKLDVSAVSTDSEIGKILDRNTLLTRAYIEKALLQMKRLAGTENRHVLSAKFCLLLGKLVLWYRQIVQQYDEASTNPASSSTPFKDFGPLNPPTSLTLPPQNSQVSHSDLPPADSMIKALEAPPMPQPGVTFTSSSSFSGAPRYPSAPGHPSLSELAQPAAPTTFTPDMPDLSATYNESTPQSSDYSSPDMTEQTGPQLSVPMEVDPSMFNQLQGADPFTYNRDPNDWMFEGLDYSNMENVADFDWLSIPEP